MKSTLDDFKMPWPGGYITPDDARQMGISEAMITRGMALAQTDCDEDEKATHFYITGGIR